MLSIAHVAQKTHCTKAVIKTTQDLILLYDIIQTDRYTYTPTI